MQHMQHCNTVQVMEKKAAAVQARSDRNRRDPSPDTGDLPDQEQSLEQSSEPPAGSGSASLPTDAATAAHTDAVAAGDSSSCSSSSSTSSSSSSKGRGSRSKKQASVSLLEDDDAELDADATVYSDDVSTASDSPELLQLVELEGDGSSNTNEPLKRTILKEMTTSIYAMEVESHPVQVGDAPEPFLRVNIRGQAFLYNQVVHHSLLLV
jgi:hypothetical protein